MSRNTTEYVLEQEIQHTFSDARFSIRTLLLLSVFAIGVFLFGIEPKVFEYDLDNPLFILLIILGQHYITLNNYIKYENLRKIYDDHSFNLNEEIKELNNKIEKSNSAISFFSDSNHPDVIYHKKLIENYENQITYRRKFIEAKKLINDKINGKYVFWLCGISIGAGIISIIKKLFSISC